LASERILEDFDVVALDVGKPHHDLEATVAFEH
jgi:hypothetical protein